MKDAYRKSRIIEIIAAILINVVTGALIYYSITESSSASEARNAVKHMNFMIEAAYAESSDADKINASMIEMKNCSLVKSSGSWYMVCNLHDILNGREKALKAVTDAISGFIPVSELNLENVKISGKEYAIFLRPSSAKENSPSDNIFTASL